MRSPQRCRDVRSHVRGRAKGTSLRPQLKARSPSA